MTDATLDKEKINLFWQRRTNIKDGKIASNFRNDGRLAYDANWVKKYIKPGSKVLDLGAGTCQLALELLDYGCQITVVEKFGEFFRNVKEHPKLTKHVSDALDYKTNEKFDAILLFGVINFFTYSEEEVLYKNCYSMLKKGGYLLVKNQCGIKEELIIDKFSPALVDNYNARYPHYQMQHDLLCKFFKVEIFDIYPENLNLHNNTHFYAFSAKK